MDQRPIHARRSAFSLIELLVVVAIVSVLAAFLLPTLERSLESARQTACANNHRQVHLAFEQYCTTNGNWLPRFNTYLWTGSWTGVRQWYWNMRQELANELTSTGTVTTQSFLRCPTSRMPIGMNPYGIGGFVFTSMGSMTPYRRLSQVKWPARQIGFGDIAGSSSPAGVGGHFPYGDIGYPHTQNTNSLFLDGHILGHDILSVRTMYAEDYYSGSNLANFEAWALTLTHWSAHRPWGNP